MYWRRKNLILVLLFSIITGCSAKSDDVSVDKKQYDEEDRDILYAIEYMGLNEFENAKKTFYEMFEKTKNDFYLLRAFKLAVVEKSFDEIIEKTDEYADEDMPYYQDIYQIYLISLINKQDYELALEKALDFVDDYPEAKNFEIVANIYYLQGDYKNAAKYFEEGYNKGFDKKILLNLTNILYGNLNEKDKAINLLESHLKLHEFDLEVGMKLFSFYKEEKNLSGIINVLNLVYTQLKDEHDAQVRAKIEQLLISYLQVQNIDDSIKFLEKTNFNNLLLLDLYKKNEQYDKALELGKKIYDKDKDINIYAQIAMLEYEMATDKKAILKSVVEKFEYVLATLDNSVYQNFLGYIMIDNDYEVKKGLELVKKALQKEPNNLAYIDSLAWGEYKLKNCKVAYDKMKIIVDKIGIEEEEIKSHWKKIKECKK